MIGPRRSFAIGLIAVLPMGMYFASAINPQGLEIFAAAALALFALTVRQRLLAGEPTRAAAWGTASRSACS